MDDVITEQAEGSQVQGAGNHLPWESLELEGCPQLPVSPHRGHCPQVERGKMRREGLEKDGREGLLCHLLLGAVIPRCTSGHCQAQRGLCWGVQ